MASTSNLGAVVDWSYPENPMSVVMETWLPRHRFDVDEYHRMKELGILKPSDEVELLEGWIVDSTDRIADEGGAIDSRESKAMDAVPDSWIPFHRFTVEEYYRMAEIGLFAADARVELIEGEIIDMTPIGPRHCGIVDWLARQFQMRLGERSIVRTQGVVRLGAYGEPSPIWRCCRYVSISIKRLILLVRIHSWSLRSVIHHCKRIVWSKCRSMPTTVCPRSGSST
jgi:hypothetical protein